MKNRQTFPYPVARQLFLESFSLSQGDPLLQEYLFKDAAARRPSWRLSRECCQRLRRQLHPTISMLVSRRLHCPVDAWKAEQELKEMVGVMCAVFKRPRANQEDLAISILRGFIFRDWHFLCEEGGRPRSGDPALPHHDPYLSFCCRFLLSCHRTGVAVFDELLAVLRDAVARRNAIYVAAMDYPSVKLCLSEVIAVYNEKHPNNQVADPTGGDGQEEEMYGED